MGESTRRAKLGLANGHRPAPASTSHSIYLRTCLMSTAQRCRVNFRVERGDAETFMCAEHWRHVSEQLRESIRNAHALPAAEPARRRLLELAGRAAVLAVLLALVAQTDTVKPEGATGAAVSVEG